MAVTTGDVGSLVARLQKARWRLIHPPSHLQYFTRTSLSRLFEQSGFRVLPVEHCGFHRSLSGMVHNLVGLRWRRPTLGARLGAAIPAGLDLYLNLHDIMYLIAERR